VAAARASHLLAARGRRSGAAQGRSEPLIVVSVCLFVSSECLLTMTNLILKKQQHASEACKVI
jgi:hypothetical protein